MKNFVLILFAFMLSFAALPTNQTVFAQENKTYYAKVLNSDTYFYSQPDDDENCKLFAVPATYFVLLLDNAGEDFYYAKYSDLYGYVKKNSVTPMDGTPLNAYANSTFRNFSQSGLSIYSRPKANASVVGSLQFLQEDVPLYGEIVGDELFEQSTNVWFYCKTTIDGKSVEGFVFSYYCDAVVKPSENVEYFPEITQELVFSNSQPTGGLSDTTTAIIILAVALPCLVILYLLLAPHKRKGGQKQQKTKLAGRGKDYYEFNEDDLT